MYIAFVYIIVSQLLLYGEATQELGTAGGTSVLRFNSSGSEPCAFTHPTISVDS